MNIDLKSGVIGLILLLGVGYGIGRYAQPAEVRTEIKEVEKEVVKTKTDVVTIIKEIKNKDGSVTTETVITDKTTIDSQTDKTREQLTEIINVKPQYRIRAEAGFDLQKEEPQYAIGLEKRFMGPLSLGITGTVSNSMKFKSANLTASWEF